jgi:hypothetical protein
VNSVFQADESVDDELAVFPERWNWTHGRLTERYRVVVPLTTDQQGQANHVSYQLVKERTCD